MPADLTNSASIVSGFVRSRGRWEAVERPHTVAMVRGAEEQQNSMEVPGKADPPEDFLLPGEVREVREEKTPPPSLSLSPRVTLNVPTFPTHVPVRQEG